MIGRLLRKKFAGVQQPLGRWIIRHVLELIVLSPAILIAWLWLKLRKFEILVIGESPIISRFVAPLEPELRRRSLIPNSLDRTIVLYLCPDANLHIRRMYNQIVDIYGEEKRIRRRVIWWASRVGFDHKFLKEDKSDEMWSTNMRIHKFTDIENNEGTKFLSDLEINEAQEFICYAVRTESYYLKLAKSGVSVKPRSVRNPSEELYLDAITRLCDSVVPIFRMGKDIENALDSKKYPTVIDYATRQRSDLLDVFLLSRCKYLLVGNTGLFWISAIFGKSTLHCDLYDIRHQVLTHDLMIFQKVWLTSENRLATVSEMLKMKSEYSDERHQARLGVELVKNTADEIYAACQEMNSRIDGNWETTPEDEDLQQRYLDLVIKFSDQPTWRGGGRVGTQFLRDNQDLLK